MSTWFFKMTIKAWLVKKQSTTVPDADGGVCGGANVGSGDRDFGVNSADGGAVVGGGGGCVALAHVVEA